MLPSQRELFEIPDDVVYLNCAYMSPLLRQVREVGQAAVARKSQPWRITAQDFFTEAETARAVAATLLGVDPDGVALIPAASYGLSLAASNLPARPGQQIVVLAEEFPANVYPWQARAAQTGATIVTVPRPLDADWTAAVLQHLDRPTAIVAISPCHWTDGGRIDLVQVGARARALGAALVVDATQWLGAAPLDLAMVKPDFLVAATYKWLLGPYSLGLLYVGPAHRTSHPLEYTWIGREGSEDFSRLIDYRESYQPGARRFDVGERSNFILVPMMTAALQQILTWQVAEIAGTLQGLTTYLATEAMRLGFAVTAPQHRSGHIVGLRHPTGLPLGLLAQLAAARVFVSVRGSAIRVAPHLYNTRSDIDRLIEVLAACVGSP